MNEKKRTKNLAKGVAIYGIGTFGTKILSFLIVPLYTYFIAPEDMGVYDILMSTVNLLSPLITLQISDAAYKYLISQNDHDKDLYIRTTVQVVVVNCLIAGMLVFVVNRFFTIPYCGYFVAVLILSRAQASVHKLLRGLKNQMLFALSGLLFTVVFLTCNVIQICILHMGIVSLFQSAIMANIASIACMFLFEKRLRVRFCMKMDVGLVKRMLAYSAPLVPNSLNWWVINSSDRYIVALFLGAASNGILAIAHKFPSLLHTIFGLFTSSWMDLAVGESEEDVGEYYTKVFRTVSCFALTLMWPLIPFTKVFIMTVMDSRYRTACNYVPFYYLGTVFQSFSAIYGVGYLRSGKTNRAFTTSVYGAAVNALVNLSLIKVIGLHAASISTFVGFLCVWLARVYQNRDDLRIRVKWAEIIVLTMAAIMVALLSMHLDLKWNAVLTVIGAAAFCAMNRQYILYILKQVAKKIHK